MITALFLCKFVLQDQGRTHYHFFDGGKPYELARLCRQIYKGKGGALGVAMGLGHVAYVGPTRVVVTKYEDPKEGTKISWDEDYKYSFAVSGDAQSMSWSPRVFTRAKVGGFVPVALTEKPEGYDEVFPREGTDKALEGVFYLKREIPQLGLKVAVHPFFKEDVVYLNQGACTPEEAWAAVGRAVYGRLVKAKDGTFTLEPNYTEIGKVAVFSLDRYIEANEPKNAGETRQWLKVAILKNLDAAGWKQLVDASRTPTKISVSTGPLYDACHKMLEALRSELKDRKSALADQIPDRPPIRLVLEKQLHVRLEITLRNGSNLSF